MGSCKKKLHSVQKQQQYYNQIHRMVEYKVGDLLLLSSKNLSFKNIPAKLQKKFVGPFEVIEKIGPQAYRLDFADTWKIHNVFHISLLKRWKTSLYRVTEDETTAELNSGREENECNREDPMMEKDRKGPAASISYPMERTPPRGSYMGTSKSF